jgi:cobalt-zinc-cadmium efflux system outer membrane protein
LRDESLFVSRSTTAASRFLLVVALLIAAPAAGAMSEAEYVRRVLETGLDARVLEAEAGLARAEAVSVGIWPNPSIGWERQPNPTEDRVVGGQHTLVASIPLVLSGRLGLEARAAARSADAAEARRERARAELRSEALRAFGTALAATRRREILHKAVAALDEMARIIGVRERAGEAAGYDRARILLERASVDSEVKAAVTEEQRARTSALRLLGSQDSSLDLDETLVPARPTADIAALVSAIETSRADLEALRLDKESAELSRRAASRAWIPDPTVGAGALILEDAQHGDAVGAVVGLSITMPLFDHGQGDRARAEAARTLAVARYNRLLQAARTDLTLAAESLRARRAQLQHFREDVLARAKEVQGIAAAGYRGGGVDLLAVVDAERSMREAELAEVAHELEVREAENNLQLISGAYDHAETGSVR